MVAIATNIVYDKDKGRYTMSRVSIGRRVTYVSRQIIKLRNKCLDDFECEVSAAHVHAFIYFAHNIGCSEKQAAAAIGKDKTSIAKSVKKLCEMQLITAKPDETDARIKRISLTQKGRQEMIKVGKALEAVSVIMSKDLGSEQVQAFLDILSAIQNNVQDNLEGRN